MTHAVWHACMYGNPIILQAHAVLLLTYRLLQALAKAPYRQMQWLWHYTINIAGVQKGCNVQQHTISSPCIQNKC